MKRSVKRQLSKAQFKEQLTKHGFRSSVGAAFGLWYEDTTGATPGHNYGAVLNPRTYNTDYRETMRSLIRERRRLSRRGAANA